MKILCLLSTVDLSTVWSNKALLAYNNEDRDTFKLLYIEASYIVIVSFFNECT